MMAELRNDRHQTDLGRMAAWANGDEDGAPSNGKGTEPVTCPGDTPDDRLRDVLLWLFLPSVVGVVSVWVGSTVGSTYRAGTAGLSSVSI